MTRIRPLVAAALLALCLFGCSGLITRYTYQEMPDPAGHNTAGPEPESTPAPPAPEQTEDGAETPAGISPDDYDYYQLAADMEAAYRAGNPTVRDDSGTLLDPEIALGFIKMILPRYTSLRTNSRTVDGVLDAVTYECEFPLPIDVRFADAEAALRAAVDECVDPGATDREKLGAIHDWIVNRNVYPDVYGDDSHSAAALVFHGNALCSGYADAFKIMCDYAGIPCVNVFGTVESDGVSNDHGWNAVLVDGDWLHVDATFDDPKTFDGVDVLNHDYFLIPTEEIEKDHAFDMAIDWTKQLGFAEWYYEVRS